VKVKTITFTLDAKFDATGIALSLQKRYPELLAFEVKGPFEVKKIDPSRSEIER
jgi:hypothetical protein